MPSAAALVLWVATTAGAAGVSVESGAKLALGIGTLAANCADVSVSGTLDVGSGLLDGARAVSVQPGGSLLGGEGTIRAAGSWINSGSFLAGTGTVELADGCSVTGLSIEGASRFANLTLATTTGKQFTFEAGSTQTIGGLLSLSGAPGNLLRIRSTRMGTTAFLNVQGASAASYIDVEDNSTAPGNPIAVGSESIIGPNTDGWLLAPGIPALPLAVSACLAVGLVCLAASGLRRRPS